MINDLKQWSLRNNEDLIPKLDLQEAKHIIEFVESPVFLGFPKIFPFQKKVLIGFFELACPDCNDINLSHILDIEDDKLDKLVLFEYGVCPKCGKNKFQFYNEGKLRFYNELVGVAGTKAGKTTLVASMVAPYILHWLIIHKDFRKWLEIIPWTTLQMVFVATSREQVKRTGWDYFRTTIENSVWFQSLFKQLDDFARKRRISRDRLYVKNLTSLQLVWLNLEILGLHSNSFSIAGGTFIFAYIDEIARFDLTESKRSADEIYRVCRNNLVPVRESLKNRLDQKDIYKNGNVIDAIFAITSSPLSIDDKSMQLLESSSLFQRRFYFYKSSFDANPLLQRERFFEVLEEDPTGFSRDFDAEPDDGGTAFISNIEIIKRAIQSVQPCVDWTLELKPAGFIGQKENIRVCVKFLNAQRERMNPFFVHADPGRFSDSFGIVLGKLLDEENYKIIITDVIDISIPKKNSKVLYEIDFESVKDFLLQLSKFIYIRCLSFDRWNSAYYVQILRDAGLVVKDFNMSYDNYLSFRQDLFAQKIIFPKPRLEEWERKPIKDLSGVDKMLKELYMLRDYGKKVDHPANGSNDLIIGAIGIHASVIQSIYNKNNFLGRDDKKRYNMMHGRVVRLNRFV